MNNEIIIQQKELINILKERVNELEYKCKRLEEQAKFSDQLRAAELMSASLKSAGDPTYNKGE